MYTQHLGFHGLELNMQKGTNIQVYVQSILAHLAFASHPRITRRENEGHDSSSHTFGCR